MNQSFTLTFPSKNKSLFRWMGRFVLLASATLFMGLAGGKIGWPILGFTTLLLDLSFFRKNDKSKALSVGLFTQAIGWTFTGQWPMAITLLLLFILHGQSLKQNYLQLDGKGIRQSFPWPKHVTWSQLEFIILKDGLLTMEYKNGRVFQQPIEKNPALSEANFNEFCQQQCNP